MRTKSAMLILVSLLFTALPGFISVQNSEAQYLTGSIVGIISDQSGAVVPGAQVLVRNIQTGLTRQVTTDTSEFFLAPFDCEFRSADLARNFLAHRARADQYGYGPLPHIQIE